MRSVGSSHRVCDQWELELASSSYQLLSGLPITLNYSLGNGFPKVYIIW